MAVGTFGRMILGLQVAILSLCVVSALPCRAEGEPDFARSGPYLGAGLGFAHDAAAEDELERLSGVDVNIKTSAALQARLGYRVAPHLATELQLEYGPKFKGEAMGVEGAKYHIVTFTGNVKVPLSRGRVQPYGLAGLGFMHLQIEDTLGYGFSWDDTDFALRFGGGLDLYATERVSLGLDVGYVLPFDDLDDTDYVSLVAGLKYHF